MGKKRKVDLSSRCYKSEKHVILNSERLSSLHRRNPKKSILSGSERWLWKPKYKRVILKISGEALAEDKHVGLDEEMLDKVALEVKQIRDMGVQVAVVVGVRQLLERAHQQQYGSLYRGLYGNAGDCNQFTGAAGRF